MNCIIKRVLLIQPEYKFKYLDIPIGLLYLASHLQRNAINVKIYDKGIGNLKSAINKFKPQIIGLYATVLHAKIIEKYIKIIKEINPNILIFLGGPYPSIFYDKLIKNPRVDGIIIGEGEDSFLKVIKEFNNNSSNFKDIEGLVLKHKGNVITNLKHSFIDLSKLPLPDYRLLDMKSYIKKWPYFDYLNNIKGTSIITSRGCPFNCSYCQPYSKNMFGLKTRRHNAKDVVEKMHELNKLYQINSFFFHDDTFITNKEWVKEFCTLLIKSKSNYKWICNTRIETISSDIIKLMTKANCKEIRLGIETINPKVQKFYNKIIPIKDIHSAISIIKKEGIKVFGFFIIGAPMESRNDILKTINFAVRSNLNITRFSILVNMPGTYLSDHIKTKSSFEGFDYIKNSKNNCSNIPYKELVRIRRIAYILFYFHPKRILSTLHSLLSLRSIMAKLERF